MPANAYTEEAQELAEWYVDEGWQELGESTPTMAGLARQLRVVRRTLYLWREKSPAFAEVCERLQDSQEFSLINGGLGNKLNANIVKLMLANHGYSDKQAIDHTSSDRTMSPKDVDQGVVKALVDKLTD